MMEKQMKLMRFKVLLVSTLSILPLLANTSEIVTSPETLEARSLVKAFGNNLKHVLKTSMKSGGPIKALEQCNMQAGPIAQEIALSSGWGIGRTSLKVRNENNLPDNWEMTTLRQFENRKAAGENLKTMEYAETVKEGDKLVYRYMKAIPTAGLCITCHGGSISQDITQKVKSLYPNDQATGFMVGDIRGAFSLQKIIN